MNAIASQLSNFIRWQTTSKRIDDQSVAMVRVVGCADETTRAALQAKLVEKLDMHVLPNHVTISCELLEECLWKEPNKSTHADEEAVVYLSPDADAALDPCKRPPRVVVVGLLIDRRVQPGVQAQHGGEAMAIGGLLSGNQRQGATQCGLRFGRHATVVVEFGGCFCKS
jgi:hypothetical protein